MLMGTEWGEAMQIELLGASVHIVQSGKGKNALLLLHGWGCSAQLMRGVQTEFEGSKRVVSLDFPGHGESGRPPEPWGVPEYAAMTAALIERLSLAPCDIVAHSFGARVAIYLAGERPELVRRLVLTGAAGIKKPQSGGASARRRLYKGLRGAMDAAERTRLFGSLPERGREALVQRFGSPDYRALDPEMRKTFVKVISLDLSDRLPRIQAPTLLYWGAQDTETPLWMGQKMEAAIPDAGLVVEEGAGHFAYLERSATFLRVLHSFLDDAREGGAG